MSLSFFILKLPKPSASHLSSFKLINFPLVRNSVVSFSSPAPSTSAVELNSNAAAGVSSDPAASEEDAAGVGTEKVGAEEVDDKEAGPNPELLNLNVPPVNVGTAPKGESVLAPAPKPDDPKLLPPNTPDPNPLPNTEVGFDPAAGLESAALSLLASPLLSSSLVVFAGGAVDPNPNPIPAEPNPTGLGGEPEPKAPTPKVGDLGKDGDEGLPRPMPNEGVLGAVNVGTAPEEPKDPEPKEEDPNEEEGGAEPKASLGAGSELGPDSLENVSFAFSAGFSFPNRLFPPNTLDEVDEVSKAEPEEAAKGFAGGVDDKPDSIFVAKDETEGATNAPPLPNREVDVELASLLSDPNTLDPKVPLPKAGSEDEENGEEVGGAASDLGLLLVVDSLNFGADDLRSSADDDVEDFVGAALEPNVNEEGGVTDGTKAATLPPFVVGDEEDTTSKEVVDTVCPPKENPDLTTGGGAGGVAVVVLILSLLDWISS